jgi:acetamidase/formamidase
MAIYHIEPERATLHGCFARDLAPVLTIEPGDTVRYRTLDADWIIADVANADHPVQLMEDLGTRFSPRDPQRDEGHALCGPVAIQGAQRGMMLAVHINRIVPDNWGWTYPWIGTPREEKDAIPLILWTLDAATMTGRNQYKQTVALRPFMGVMGMPPDEPGILSTQPPRLTGGNLDCKELVAGSTLYLPIAVPGGLFSVGDGHAAQGDGESGGTAIECPMALVDLTFGLLSDPPVTTPYANTPAGWICFGLDSDLNLAADMALQAMVTLLATFYGVSEKVALGLAGVVVDLHITQTVNGVRGVHAMLPHGALRK